MNRKAPLLPLARQRSVAGHRSAASACARLVGCPLLVGVALLSGLSARGEDQVLAQRRARVESLSIAEKETLRRNQQRFAEMDEVRQQSLRELHTKLATSPEGERLWSVLRLYHQWMQSLPAGERLELLALPAEERVRAIKVLIERQERDRFQELVQKSLSLKDREAIMDWLADMALRRLPPGEQQRLRAIEHPVRRRIETIALFRRRAGGTNDVRFRELLEPTAADRKALIDQLSESAQQTIAAVKGDPEKRRLLQTWINAAIFSRRDNRPQVGRATLEAFVAKLDPAERDYLNNLPPQRKREELQRLYMRNRMRRPGEFRPPFAPDRRRGGDPR